MAEKRQRPNKDASKKTRQKGNGEGEKVRYNIEEVMSTICGCIAQGLPLVKILTLDGMPSYATVMRWLSEDSSIQDNYTRAREASADYLADEIVYIADNELDPQVARVRIDARKWVAAKMKPKKYGDKVIHAGDEESPIKHVHDLTEEALLAIATRSGS